MELTSLRNIGAEMDTKLRAVGIHTAEDLRQTGSREAFFRLKTLYPEVCLVHLYELEGAIIDVDFNALPEDTRKALKQISNSLK